MTKTLSIALLIVSFYCLGMLVWWSYGLKKPENTITDYARIGIEAGLNAAIVKGKPTTRAELDDARDYARSLVEKMYPDVKFKWPKLQEHEAKLPPECRWSNDDVPGADCLLCSTTGFRYERRPLVRWGHWVAGYPYGNWHYIRAEYAVR